jgi:hypothetical protein
VVIQSAPTRASPPTGPTATTPAPPPVQAHRPREDPDVWLRCVFLLGHSSRPGDRPSGRSPRSGTASRRLSFRPPSAAGADCIDDDPERRQVLDELLTRSWSGTRRRSKLVRRPRRRFRQATAPTSTAHVKLVELAEAWR